MDAIKRGDYLRLRNGYGNWVEGRALSGVVLGGRDAIVWVCAAEQWPQLEHADPQEGTPWPIEAIEVEGPTARRKTA